MAETKKLTREQAFEAGAKKVDAKHTIRIHDISQASYDKKDGTKGYVYNVDLRRVYNQPTSEFLSNVVDKNPAFNLNNMNVTHEVCIPDTYTAVVDVATNTRIKGLTAVQAGRESVQAVREIPKFITTSTYSAKDLETLITESTAPKTAVKFEERKDGTKDSRAGKMITVGGKSYPVENLLNKTVVSGTYRVDFMNDAKQKNAAGELYPVASKARAAMGKEYGEKFRKLTEATGAQIDGELMKYAHPTERRLDLRPNSPQKLVPSEVGYDASLDSKNRAIGKMYKSLLVENGFAFKASQLVDVTSDVYDKQTHERVMLTINNLGSKYKMDTKMYGENPSQTDCKVMVDEILLRSQKNVLTLCQTHGAKENKAMVDAVAKAEHNVKFEASVEDKYILDHTIEYDRITGISNTMIRAAEAKAKGQQMNAPEGAMPRADYIYADPSKKAFLDLTSANCVPVLARDAVAPVQSIEPLSVPTETATQFEGVVADKEVAGLGE